MGAVVYDAKVPDAALLMTNWFGTPVAVKSHYINAGVS